MPIYEYQCNKCHHQFEAIVRGGSTPDCPECASEDLEKLISTPAVSTEKTRSRNMSIARQRASKIRTEKESAQREYERNYIKDHS